MSQAFGVRAISPGGANTPHVFAFSTARVGSDGLLEVWNGPTQGDLIFKVRGDGIVEVTQGVHVQSVDAAFLVLDSNAAGVGDDSAAIHFQHNGVDRWVLRKQDAATADLILERFDDAGVLQGEALRFVRATGEVQFEGRAEIPVLRLANGSITLASGNHNNLAPGDVGFLRCTPAGGGSTITGISGGLDGRQLIIYNLGGGSITLAHQSTASTSTNRIIGGAGGANVPVAESFGVPLIYDGSVSRWRVFAL